MTQSGADSELTQRIIENNQQKFGGSSLGNQFMVFATMCDLDDAGQLDKESKELVGAAVVRSIVEGIDHPAALEIVESTREVGKNYLAQHPIVKESQPVGPSSEELVADYLNINRVVSSPDPTPSAPGRSVWDRIFGR